MNLEAKVKALEKENRRLKRKIERTNSYSQQVIKTAQEAHSKGNIPKTSWAYYKAAYEVAYNVVKMLNT